MGSYKEKNTKKKILPIFTFFTLFVANAFGNNDATLKVGAKGKEVVEATIMKIMTECLFDDDYSFIRRLAYVETTDGTDNDTFAPGFYGGIWKV